MNYNFLQIESILPTDEFEDWYEYQKNNYLENLLYNTENPGDDQWTI